MVGIFTIRSLALLHVKFSINSIKKVFFIIVVLSLASLMPVKSLGELSLRLSLFSQGRIIYGSNNYVWIYEFANYKIFAPWWRVTLGTSASLTLTPLGLNVTGGWACLRLHETVGNKSAILEFGNGSANYGVGFIGFNGKMWRIAFYAGKIQLIFADAYGKNAITIPLFNSIRPVRIGIQFINSSSLEYYLQYSNSTSIRKVFMAPRELSEPRCVELFLNGEAFFTRLYVAENFDAILNGESVKVAVKCDEWYPPLNLPAPKKPLLLGVHTTMITNKLIDGWIRFTEKNINRDLNFLKKYKFNALRLSLDWEGIMPNIGQFNITVLNWIQNFTSNANRNGFHVILFIGSYYLSYIPFQGEMNDEWLNYVMNNETLREALISTWVRVAEYVKDLNISYELLNEPDAGESGGEIGFLKQVKLFDDIGKAIRQIDSDHIIYVPTYQWQNKQELWATKNIVFNFTNYGFSLHVYPTKDNMNDLNLGYKDAFISWLKNSNLPIIITETPMTTLDPWISESVLPDPYTWQDAWNKTISFIDSFQELRGVIFLRCMVTMDSGTYSKLDILTNLFEAFTKQCNSLLG